MDKQRFFLAFVPLTILVLIADHFGFDNLYLFLKPLPAILCSWFAFSQVRTNGYDSKIQKFILLAFLMCGIGDFLLAMADGYPIGNGWFLAGMLSFAIAHVGLIGSLVAGVPVSTIKEKRHWGQLACATLVLVFGAEFFILNREYFGSLGLPVLVYCVLLVTMVISAALRMMHHGKESYFAILWGALLFMTSDALLATVIFTDHLDLAEILVLPLYFSAIGLLAYGFSSGKAGSYKP
ncbi:MAG: lysoplasmalogenase family protein [Bacteroidota bacterium]